MKALPILPGVEPSRDDNGVPRCTEDECPSYDGKRCEKLGHRPSEFCEPQLDADYEAMRAEPAPKLQAQKCPQCGGPFAPGTGIICTDMRTLVCSLACADDVNERQPGAPPQTPAAADMLAHVVFLLLRDYVTVGEMENVLQDMGRIDGAVDYSGDGAEHVIAYARDVAARVLGGK